MRRYGVKVPGPLEAHYNLAPGMQVPVILDKAPGVLKSALWGITGSATVPGRFGRPVTALDITQPKNQEIIHTALAWRCLIPADGFYLWRQVSRRSRVPYRVTLKWSLPFAFAGIWVEDVSESTTAVALLTTGSNSLLEPLQASMPLILSLEEEKQWLTEGIGLADLQRISFPADGMKIFPVSPLVNEKSNNSAAIIQPVQPADQFGNYFLFE